MFRHSNLLRDHTSATEKLEIDLPTDPTSHLIISVSGFNVTDEATLAEFLAFLNTVVVSDEGTTIVSLQSEDLYGVHSYVLGKRPILTNRIATDNAVRTLAMVVPFGRRLYDPDECYPARSKGELTLYADMTVLGTSIDNGIVNIDCVQLPGASPSHFMKSRLMVVSAPGATGENGVSLPLGNELIALQIRQTTIPTTAAHTTGVESASVTRDEKETGYVAASHETRFGINALRMDGMTGTIAAQGAELPASISWLDYDPLRDGQHLLDLSGAKAAKLVLDMGVDEATNVTVMERVAV